MSPALLSPITGAPLVVDGKSALRDADGSRWPVVDGIPFLRIGRDALRVEVLARLDADDRSGALVLLLADQDDWWNGAKPDPQALRDLVDQASALTLREAMDRLGFDRVGHYFAHRWSDPTFLAGLALLEAHWRPATSAFELACGIGHYGRELMRRGLGYTGADVVFSKLWLARHWVLPAGATLVCFDAAAPWPIADQRFDLIFCHDGFYFLEPKPAILATLRGLVGPEGRLALGHIHNAGAENLSAGRSVSADDMAALFPQAAIYDDAELTKALVEARGPQAQPLSALRTVEAFSVEDRPKTPARSIEAGLAMPPPDAALRLNPLYADAGGGPAVVWPSPRYEAEYAPRATYPTRLTPEGIAQLQGAGKQDATRRRILVDLPERW